MPLVAKRRTISARTFPKMLHGMVKRLFLFVCFCVGYLSFEYVCVLSIYKQPII